MELLIKEIVYVSSFYENNWKLSPGMILRRFLVFFADIQPGDLCKNYSYKNGVGHRREDFC